MSRRVKLSVWSVLPICAMSLLALQAAPAAPMTEVSEIWADYLSLPMCFERYEAGSPSGVCYVSRNPQFDVYLAPCEVLILRKASSDGQPSHKMLRIGLAGGRADATAEVLRPLPGHVNYLKGPDAFKWRTRVPTFGKVRFADVYRGIDVLYYGNGGSLEFDFVVHPGADPESIALSIEGADAAEVDSGGDLLFTVNGIPTRFHAPEIFQERDGVRTRIPGHYLLDAEGGVFFHVDPYDATLPLIIDPVINFVSFAGVPSADARGVGVDAEGNMYICGMTTSADLKLPGPHYDTTLGGDEDIFLVKFRPDGKEVLYSTYIGGSDKDAGKTMYVDPEGFAYIGGNTKSSDLPTEGFISHYGPTYDLLVLKVKPDGDGLDYCCVFGGEGMEEFRGITVDSQGNCIAVGGSHSPDMPTTPGSHQPIYNDPPEDTPDVAGSFTKGEDAIIAKINPAGTDFVFLTWLGGHGFEKAWGVVTDSADDIYLTGHVEARDFPVTAGAFQMTHGGGTARAEDQYGPKDAFVAKISADGSRLLAATYFGGEGQDVGYGIGLDAQGNVYLAGNTASTNLPVVNAVQPAYNGGDSDTYLAKMDPGLTRLLFSTYLGGPGKDELCSDGLAVDASGFAYAVGGAGTGFPSTPDAFLDHHVGGNSDGFLVRFTPEGRLDYATLLGGSGEDQCGAVALGGRRIALVAGRTTSHDFKLHRPYRSELSAGRDAFLVKLDFADASATSNQK
ncbi:MAG: SBBP repeat-containing protein [Candidatus Hydrogenedentes bacterium]|nr:SBBP repeat-containing protein [Candidatus Hydrogenedentota bacterium]